MNEIKSIDVDRQPDFPPWLASLMLRRGGSTLSRFAFYYRKLASQPRPWRRRLQRKLAVTLTSTALLLALAGPTAYLGASQDSPASAIYVADGVVEIAADGRCSLIEAIINANNDAATYPDCATGSGADTIQLPAGGTFTLTQAYDANYNGLPPIIGAMTIEGNGATITNSGWIPAFGTLRVTASGDLTLAATTISGGYLTDAYPYGPSAAAIANAGTLNISGSRIVDNYSYAGTGAGGISNSGSMTITNSEISGNGGSFRGDTGGILNSGHMTIANSAVLVNYGCYAGAAIYNLGEAVLSNTTVSGNFDGWCGEHGYYVDSSIRNKGVLTINNSTVTGNDGNNKGAVLNYGTLTLNGSIVSGNYSYCTGEDYYCQKNVTNNGTVIANAFNVFGAESVSGVDGFQPGQKDVIPNQPLDDVIIPLSFNGGNLLTHSLPPGSPAIDLAPSANCAAETIGGIDQRGQPRNSDGDGKNSYHECDAGALEMQPVELENAVLVTTTAGGTTTDGLRFRKTDILKWNGTAWSKFFAGRSKGLPPTADIAAVSVPSAVEPDIYMSFAGNLRVPGVGFVTPRDVVHWDGSRFNLFFDGSDVGLTTIGERIDALEVLPYYFGCNTALLFSFTGIGKLPGSDDLVEPLPFAGEDTLVFCLRRSGPGTLGELDRYPFYLHAGWEMFLDGSDKGMPPNATFGLAITPRQAIESPNWYNGDSMFLITRGPFTLDGAAGTHSMVYRYEWREEFGDWFSGPYFSAADHGLLQKVDGLEVLGDLP